MSSVRGSHTIACALAIACAALASRSTAQQPTDTKRAETLFQEGKKLLDQGKTDAACPKLQESFGVDQAVGTLGLLAHCHQKQGHRGLAWREFTQTAELARKAGQAKREQVARDFAANLEKSLPSIRIVVSNRTGELTITRAGDEVPEADWGKPIPVDPGSIEIKASAPGHKAWSITIEAPAERGIVEVSVPALQSDNPKKVPSAPAVSSSSMTPKSEPSDTANQEQARSSIVPGLVLTAVGAVGLGVGGFFGLRAMSKNSDSKASCNGANECDPQGGALRDEAKSAATISTIAFGVGAAGLGVGLVMILTRGSSPKKESSRIWLAPDAGANHAGLGFGGRF